MREHRVTHIELRAGHDPSAQDIIVYCRERLAGFECPKDIVFGALPTTATGKIQKFALRSKAREA